MAKLIHCPGCGRGWSYPYPDDCPKCGEDLDDVEEESRGEDDGEVPHDEAATLKPAEMTTYQLRDDLRNLGLKISGVKTELVERLQAAWDDDEAKLLPFEQAS